MGRACFSWQRGAALKTLLFLDGFCAYANGNKSCAIGTLVPDQKKPTELPLKKGIQGANSYETENGVLGVLRCCHIIKSGKVSNSIKDSLES